MKNFKKLPERNTSLVEIPGHVSSVGVPRIWKKGKQGRKEGINYQINKQMNNQMTEYQGNG